MGRRCAGAALLLLLLALLFVSAQVFAWGGQEDVVRIGFVGTLTGRFSDLGVAARDGARLAVSDWNRRGGVRGTAVELLVADDEADVAVGTRAAEALLERGVRLLVGHMFSIMVPTVETMLRDHDLLYVSPTMTTPQLSGQDDGFFRVISDSQAHVDAVLSAFPEDTAGSPVVVLLDTSNEAYTEPAARRAEAILGDRAVRLSFNSRTNNSYLRLAEQTMELDPAVVLCVCAGRDAAVYAQQLSKLDYGGRLLGVLWTFDDSLIELGGLSVEGMIVPGPYLPPHPAERYREFYRAFEARYGVPPEFTARLAYEAVFVLLTAVEAAESPEPGAVKSALLDIQDFDIFSDPVVFDRYGDAIRRISLYRVEDGEFVNIGQYRPGAP